MNRNRGTNIFASIGKALFESNMGRIRWRSNMWAVIGSPWDKGRISRPDLANSRNCGVNENGHFVRDDRVLVRKPHVLCPNAPEPQGNFFRDDKEHWWVPRVLCVKCQFFRASNRTVRFPRCAFKGDDLAKAAEQTLVQISDAVKTATKQVDEIMRGER